MLALWVGIIVFFIIAIIFSKIQIIIQDFKFSTQNQKNINQEYKIILKLYLLFKIPIIKIVITKEKIEKLKTKPNIKKIEKRIKTDNSKIKKYILKIIKEIKIQNVKLRIELGTENASFTAILIPVVSTIISVFIRKKIEDYKNQSFMVIPIYKNQNLINIAINSTLEMKMIHILNSIYVLKRKKVNN